MANSRFYQFLFSKVPILTMIQGSATFGASGAVASSSGAGVYAVTKLGTGIYQVQLQDNYNAFIGAAFTPQAVGQGSAVTAGSFVVGTLYQIVTLGTTVYSAIGLNSGLTAAVGQLFVATGVGSGTGTAKAVGYTDMDLIQVPDCAQMLQPSTQGQGSILIFNTYQSTVIGITGDTHTNTTVDNLSSIAGIEVGQAISGTGIPLGARVATIASATSITISAAATATAAGVALSVGPAKVLADPVSGSILQFRFYLRNSSNTY